jgi:hypothetical protein
MGRIKMKLINTRYGVLNTPQREIFLDGVGIQKQRKNARMMKYGALAIGLIVIAVHLIGWGWV